MKKMLRRPTVPIPVGAGKSIDDILNEMKLTAFQGRKLAETVDVWSRMLRKIRTVIWFGFAGAMIPAGMRRLLAYLSREDVGRYNNLIRRLGLRK